MRVRTLIFVAVAIAAVSIAAAASANQRAVRVEYRYPVVARDVIVPRTSSVVETSSLFSNERVVVWAGTDGLERRYMYLEEKWVDGRLESRQTIHPEGKPRSTTITTGTPEIVLVGTRPGKAFGVAADAEAGQAIGSIGASGTLEVEVRGSITFGPAGTEAGPAGNATYHYYNAPFRKDVPPGAILFRAGKGRWLWLRELTAEGDRYVVPGLPGDRVVARVNDAPGQYGDNRGSFQVIVWPEDVRP